MNNQPQFVQPIYIVNQTSHETEGASTTALWLEIIFGLFSLLGIGQVYSGRVILGICMMIGWWIYIAIASILSALTWGICACLFVPIYLSVPIISGIQARTYVKTTGGKGSWKSVGLVAGGGCLVVIISIIIIIIFGGVIIGILSQGQN
jgi:hypothetical protein